MRKKVLCTLLCVVLMLGFCSSFAMATGTVLNIKPPETMPKSGETFVVSVDISGNPGFSAAQFTLTFDPNAMDCTAIRKGGILNGMVSAVNPDAKKGAMLAAASTGSVNTDGTLAEFVFTAKRDISEMKFSLCDAVLNDQSGGRLSYMVTGGEMSAPSTTPTTPQDITGTGTGSPKEADSEVHAQESVQENNYFTDTENHWAKDYISKASSLGLFKGYPDGTFKPDINVSRAEFVTVLYRMAGSPAVADLETPFADISGQIDEFKTAIAWCYQNGYIDGTSKTTFSPASPLTREAAMKILFYYAGGQSEAELMFTSIYDANYKDSEEISSWAKASMYWGVYKGIISGTSVDTLSPQGTATRAQLAKILVGYFEKTEVTN